MSAVWTAWKSIPKYIHVAIIVGGLSQLAITWSFPITTIDAGAVHHTRVIYMEVQS